MCLIEYIGESYGSAFISHKQLSFKNFQSHMKKLYPKKNDGSDVETEQQSDTVNKKKPKSNNATV